MQNAAHSTALQPVASYPDIPYFSAQIDAGRAIVSALLTDYTGDIAVQLWDGSLAAGDERSSCRLVFRQPGALRDLILHHDLIRLTEYYLEGQIDVIGDMESLFKLTPYLTGLQLSWREKWQLISLALHLPISAMHSQQKNPGHENSSDTIAHHYDVGNAFYQLWLDPEMVYSCAYFQHKNESLAEAQRNKLDYICRKLHLSSGQTLLDIGCGWGALAIWAARYYGVKVRGITLSEEQYRYARQRVKDEGLSDAVTIELMDYRDLPEDTQYDRVVSVGMFEHIGLKNFVRYFSLVKRVLKPGGLFLNHGISNKEGWRRTPSTRFINHYVFPDGELTAISEVSRAMEEAGFELLDIEALRRHYAQTLRHWVKALAAKKDQAIQLTSRESYRLWKLYMAGCAYFFDAGGINVYQVLAGHAGQPLEIPLTRDDLYHTGTSQPSRVSR